MSDTPRSDEMEVSGHAHYLSLELARTLERELAVARKGLEAVESLMNESNGVGGLHLNGDFAPWNELRTGGRFEEWLGAFDDALNAARSSNTLLGKILDCVQYDVDTNLQMGILPVDQVRTARNAIISGTIAALTSYIGWDVNEARELAALILEDVNDHEWAARLRGAE